MSLASRGERITSAMHRRIAPTVRYSQIDYEEFLFRRAGHATAWLDLGCGHRLLPEWRGAAERRLLSLVPFVVGADYDFDSLRAHRSIRHRVRADARQLPFPDEAFDLITANMVVEHLDDPERQFADIARILRPGGVFVFHTPNASSYFVAIARRLPDALKTRLARFFEGRVSEDVFHTHYRANRVRDIRRIAGRTGFAVDEMKLTSSVPNTRVLPFFAVFELLLLRALEHPRLAGYRTNIICALRKQPTEARVLSAVAT
ncbi:MAG TPA: methyltransferase domain-containing protein [Gemmatimonadaceae bacterium]|nr:methyltransferase domain-containing protein [Gemmatimonadaceae bacterium]